MPRGREITISTRSRDPPTLKTSPRFAVGMVRETVTRVSSASGVGRPGSAISSHGHPNGSAAPDATTSSTRPPRASARARVRR
ncbi:hypothetical protein SGRIM128S_07320 [Streptomyces griseomycini]